MAIQVWIENGQQITLEELLELVPNSKAAKEVEQMRTALKDIAEWTDRYTTPGHPVSNIARRAFGENADL